MMRSSTDIRLVLPSLLAVALAASVAIVTAQAAPLSIALSGLVILSAAVAISLEPLAGAVLGLIISATIVGASRAFGVWNELVFLPTAVACLAALATPWLAAQLGSRVQRAVRRPSGWAGNTPAIGSLGLVDASVGEALLGHEILRAEHVQSPLSLLRVAVRFDPMGTMEDRAQACRAVTRILDSTIHAIDIPYAYAINDLGVILPGTDGSGARVLGARITSALASATVRTAGRERQPLGDFATVSIGSAGFPLDGATTASLVESAHPDNAPAYISTRGLTDPARSEVDDPGSAVQVPGPQSSRVGGHLAAVGPGSRPWLTAVPMDSARKSAGWAHDTKPEDATVVSSVS